MTYDLAKKLKDAGFKCEKYKIYSYPDGVFHPEYDIPTGILCPNPTLQDLIEACGEGIFNLIKNSEWEFNQSGHRWTATLANPTKMKSLTLTAVKECLVNGHGSAPEEAVANLWLALNKKS